MSRVERVGLPPRPFLYTLDQIASLLSVEELALKTTWIYFEGRSTGMKGVRRMLARNISVDANAKPDWRVADQEFVRWMKQMGYRFYDSSYTRL